MEIFEYAFMQRAFIVGILLAAIIPCIGLVIVCKRLSMIGDTQEDSQIFGNVHCYHYVCRDWPGGRFVRIY